MVRDSISEDSEVLKAYDAIAPLYEKYSQNKMAYLDAVDNLVISYLKSEDRLLDIGAGDGRRLKKIKDSVGISDIVAVEPSSGMAKICKKAIDAPVHEIFAEDINKLNIGKFNVVTALWNVLGHIPSSEARLKSLENIRDVLDEDGKLILDVNNRHNAPAYGYFNVGIRFLIDTLNFKEVRGDATYDWKIGEQVFKSKGHLFTPAEIERLITKSGLRVKSRFSLNYATGEISQSKFKGQLFYIIERK